MLFSSQAQQQLSMKKSVRYRKTAAAQDSAESSKAAAKSTRIQAAVASRNGPARQPAEGVALKRLQWLTHLRRYQQTPLPRPAQVR